jgi:DNA-binding CsgD family transcriptional regulator
VTLLLEAAALSGDKTTARLLLDLTAGDERYLAKPLLVLMPRHAGLASALLGRYQDARNYFARAIEFCERVGYRPELALTRLDLAELILTHFPREQAEARRHIDQAVPELEAMSMQAAWQRALQLRGGVSIERNVAHLPDGLSPREAEVLRLIAEGKSNQQIAAELVISFNTVQRHVSNILTKTSLANRTEAASYAHRHGLA